MPAERGWNDVVDLELDGSKASDEKECQARADPLRRLRWRAQAGRAIRNVRGRSAQRSGGGETQKGLGERIDVAWLGEASDGVGFERAKLDPPAKEPGSLHPHSEGHEADSQVEADEAQTIGVHVHDEAP